ncbi:MAG: TRAP transporter permease [Clostridia bacterium]|jgi:TRAP transporter 4TM/12TM fusion protein|nr:TRAP transporter permease [Clostridia bacterium]
MSKDVDKKDVRLASGSSEQVDSNMPIDLEPDLEAENSSLRSLSGGVGKFVAVFAALVALFHVISLKFYPLETWTFRTLHIASLSFLGFLLVPGWQKAKERIHWSDWIFAILSLVVSGYIVYNLDQLIFRAGVMPKTPDFIIALIGVILVLELARRTAGNSLPILAGVFILYAFVGPYLPGVLKHKGYSMERFFTYIYGLDGVFSVPIDISSRYIILFIIFSAFLQYSGVGKYFVEWAFSISGHLRGGPAKVAVLSSALMGTMNGTSAGNVVATGSLTIPLMKKVGYSPQFAAATEAVASTGGQIMPPIMGAGVFIMAELTGIPYQRIMLAGIVPAILYFLSVYFMVDMEAIKQKLFGLPRHMLPSRRKVMKQSYLFLPVVILFGFLMTGKSVIFAGFYAIVASLFISWISKDTRMGFAKIFSALEAGAKGSIQLMAVCAAAGIIMGVIALTGVGLKISGLLLTIAGTSKLLALLFTMAVVIILGMGMPTTAAYAVAASVMAPGLIRMGVEPLIAHMFIFYFACLSAITPPVALAAYAGAGISGSDPMKTGLTSFRLGIASYIVPFMFFYAPEILLVGDMSITILRTITAAIGVYALAISMQGWFFGSLNGLMRAAFFGAALSLITPSVFFDVIGLAFLVGFYLFKKLFSKAAESAQVSSVN